MQPSATSTNPFPYGWRYVKRTPPNGQVELEQVPLTLDDVLHPQEGDVIPEHDIHESDRRYLADVFESRPIGPPITRVTSDLLVDWGVEGMRPHSTDVAVFVGLCRQPPSPIGTLRLGRLGGECLLALEIVSPETRSNDVVHKLAHYHQVGVPLYIIVDQERDTAPRRLVAYRWTRKGYVLRKLDEHGRLLIQPLSLFLTVRNDRVVCHDVQTERVVGTYAQLARDFAAADQRDQERERAIEEAVNQTHEEVRNRQAAEQEVARQTVARKKAERKAREERLARQEAEQRIRELEEAIRRLQGGTTA